MSSALEVDFIEMGKRLRLTLDRTDSQLQKLVLAKSDNPNICPYVVAHDAVS